MTWYRWRYWRLAWTRYGDQAESTTDGLGQWVRIVWGLWMRVA